MFYKSAKLAKGAVLALAAGALAVVSTGPLMAADDQRERRGPSTGEVIAGVALIGGIAALAGAFDRDRGRHDIGHAGWGGPAGWQGRGGFGRGQRGLVDRCVRAAEIDAQRFGGWRFANVTQVRDVDRTRNGFRVRGTIDVQGARGFGNRNFDRGRFTCFDDGRGRPIVEFRGIRGLR
ncbi:MAG: hypothetical protein ACXIT4_07060 [Erythrobacter sp.]